MDDSQKQYYEDMLDKNRGILLYENHELRGVLTFHVGSNDDKYIYGRAPWTLLDDEPDGDTLYIDQYIFKSRGIKTVHKAFSALLRCMRRQFPNIKQAKWSRAPALFRKHNIRGGRPNVYCKNIK